MSKLINILLNKLPTAEQLELDNLVFFNEASDMSYDKHFTYNGKAFMLKCTLIPSTTGIDLNITGAINNVQDFIADKSGVSFDSQGSVDFNVNCPIYDETGEISHLPMECLEHLISDGNHVAVISPAVYDVYSEESENDDDNDSNDTALEEKWQWQIHFIKIDTTV